MAKKQPSLAPRQMCHYYASKTNSSSSCTQSHIKTLRGTLSQDTLSKLGTTCLLLCRCQLLEISFQISSWCVSNRHSALASPHYKGPRKQYVNCPFLKMLSAHAKFDSAKGCHPIQIEKNSISKLQMTKIGFTG